MQILKIAVKYFTKENITEKEMRKATDEFNDIKIGFLTLLTVAALIWVLSMSGCFDEKFGNIKP